MLFVQPIINHLDIYSDLFGKGPQRRHPSRQSLNIYPVQLSIGVVMLDKMILRGFNIEEVYQFFAEFELTPSGACARKSVLILVSNR